jgi:hypothetical protein
MVADWEVAKQETAAVLYAVICGFKSRPPDRGKEKGDA